jgi:predicted nucleic acid-binding protein
MAIYLDTSLVVSLYIIDANSEAAATAIAFCSDPPILTTLCQVEVINAFSLQQFRGEITAARANFAVESFEDDLRSGVYRVLALPEFTFRQAALVSRRHTPQLGIRSMDLLHVAAALELGAAAFFSFDIQQRRLAEAVGLPLNAL